MVQSEDFFFCSKEGEVVNHFMKVKKVATLVLLKWCDYIYLIEFPIKQATTSLLP
jgi:hypothetical protein